MIIPNQIYRHFKGGLYLIVAIALEESTGEAVVIYRSLNGDDKVWSRSHIDFISPVPEGAPNPTGQKNRFELITCAKDILSNCTTENLVRELKTRPDSPFNERDIKGLNDRVAMSEYVLGEIKSAGVDAGVCLSTIMTADSLEEVEKFVENHPNRCSSRTKIFKSVLVEVKSFD